MWPLVNMKTPLIGMQIYLGLLWMVSAQLNNSNVFSLSLVAIHRVTKQRFLYNIRFYGFLFLRILWILLDQHKWKSADILYFRWNDFMFSHFTVQTYPVLYQPFCQYDVALCNFQLLLWSCLLGVPSSEG